jgi:Domain of unknown function (DUF4169)
VSIVNLNTARKARAKAAARVKADENAIKHGVSKAARLAEEKRAEKAARDLDGHKRDVD